MKNKKPLSISHIKHAHDTFFKTAMMDKRVAQEFFKAHLPKDFLPFIDLEKLELSSESYIDDLRQTTIADMLFKTEMYGSDSYLYLVVDHQSRPDKMMPFRMLKYTCNIIDQHVKETGSQSIPFVLPFVLYHGKEAWDYSTDIRDLIDAPKILTRDYFLKPFFLVDLNKIDDDILKERAWLGVMELTLKHIFDKDLQFILQDIMSLLKTILELGAQQFTEATLSYILDRGQLHDKTQFIQNVKAMLTEEMEEKMVTIAEQYWLEGLEKGKKEAEEKIATIAEQYWSGGLEKGKEENTITIAQRLLKENTDISLVAKVTGLPLAHLQEIKESR